MKILLDAGHGGNDPGAVGYNRRLEKDIALEVVLEMAKTLRDIGHVVLLTRDKDIYVSPSARLNMILKFKPECFISIHCNSFDDPKATGFEVIYRDQYDIDLAMHVSKAMQKHTGLRNRGINTDIGDLGRRLAVLGHLKTPAILVEIGFITNKSDLKVIENEKLISQAIIEGFTYWQKALLPKPQASL